MYSVAWRPTLSLLSVFRKTGNVIHKGDIQMKDPGHPGGDHRGAWVVGNRRSAGPRRNEGRSLDLFERTRIPLAPYGDTESESVRCCW